METGTSTEVDAYIATQPGPTAQALQAVREAVHEAAPHCTERLNYGIPAFALEPGGKRDQQVMMAGYARHVGFYPHPEVVAAMTDQLQGYRFAKGSVQFPLDRPMPVELVKQMVKLRVAQLGA